MNRVLMTLTGATETETLQEAAAPGGLCSSSRQPAALRNDIVRAGRFRPSQPFTALLEARAVRLWRNW